MDQKIVICVLGHMRHTAEAQQSKCDFCKTIVWCQPWNMKEKKTCISCAAGIKDATFMIKREDFIRAEQEIEKLNRGK